MTGGQVLHVNPIACGGRGLCAEIAPAVALGAAPLPYPFLPRHLTIIDS